MTAPREFVDVLGIPLWANDIQSAADLVIETSLRPERRNYRISATGAHGLVYSYKNPAFATILREFFINLPDGMPGVWVGRMKGASKMRRCYGPEFFQALMSASASLPLRHFFCGGNPGVADELKKAVAKKFNNNSVAGTFCPPYLPVNQYNYSEIGELINNSGADIVWIGLSTPKQEIFAEHLKAFTKVQFIITVGAAFDFHTDRVKQAPSMIQKLGLEWLFRLTMEPGRLYRRYAEIVPLFIYYNLRELFNFEPQKR